MQQFLLNEKVITQLHMQAVNLKDQTKFAKKYDLSAGYVPVVQPSKEIQSLLEKQRKILSKPKLDDQNHSLQNIPKTKNLLSTLRFEFLTQTQNQSTYRPVVKQNYFTARGIKKQTFKQKQSKRIIPRTCSLVTVMKSGQNYVAPYDVNPDLKFKRSPQCFFSPKVVKKTDKKFFNSSRNKQNLNLTDGFKQHHESMKTLSIKEMVDKEMQQLIKKRKANCRTAPQKHVSKINNQQGEFTLDGGMFEEDICKMQAKIYNEMRENKQKLIRRKKQRIGINIVKNKPFGENEINKCTGKILKKYHCDGMAYFQKFIPHD